MANKNESKKTMDVSKPGESAPDTSARPVLITHRPVVQDPMVKTEDKSEEEKPTEAAATTSHKVIQPLEVDGETPAVEEPAEKASDEEPEPETPAETEHAEEAAVVDAVADQANTGKKKEGPTPEELKKQEEINNLIANKQYFVPIGQVAKRRNKRTLIGISVFLAFIVAFYLVIDAGILDIGINLPVDLIPS